MYRYETRSEPSSSRQQGRHMKQFSSISTHNKIFSVSKMISQESTVQSTSILHDLKPVIVMLRVLGAMPLHLPIPGAGMATFAVLSPAMAYSVCLYIAVVVAMQFTFRLWLAGMLRGSPNFSEALYGILAVILQLMVVCLPLFNWPETKLLATLICDFSKLEMQYARVTNQSLPRLQQKRCIVICACVTVVTVLQQIMYELLLYKELSWWNYRDIAVYCYVYELRNFLALFWSLLCFVTASFAQAMLRHLQKDLATSSRSAITEYRDLWLGLSRLATRIGRTICYTYCFYLVYLMVTFTIYVYYLIFMLVEGISGNLAWLIIESLLSLVLLFAICNGANQVTTQIRDAFCEVLLSVRLSNDQQHIQHEVDVFLKVIERHPPVVTLSGYVTVDRALITSVSSAVVTYLIVLVQFRLATQSPH